MPSGSKKRKASKKPKPGEPPSSQGEPPELEPGLEESMAKDGEEMVEGSPSPRAMDEASEAMAEVGVEEGKELTGESVRKEKDEVAEVKEASAPPDQPEVNPRNPPLQIEPESKVPTISTAEGSDENEALGGTLKSQGESPPPIEEEKGIPIGETTPNSEVPPREPDADLAGLERDKDGAGAPPIDIAPEANEDEPMEAVKNEMGQEASEPGLDESPVVMEATMAREDIAPEDDMTPGDVAAVGVDAGADEIPDVREAVMDAAPEITQPEKDEAAVARELDTDAASTNIEREGTDVTPVETAGETDDGPASVQSEVDEVVVEMQPETDAGAEILLDMGTDIGAATADAPSEMDKNLVLIAADTDEDPPNVQSEMEEAADQRQPETDAVPHDLEPETAQNELNTEAAHGEDAFTGDIDQEIEPVAHVIESQTAASESEIEDCTNVALIVAEPEPDMTLREAESETEARPGEIKPEVDAVLDDTEKDEVAEADSKPEFSVTPADIEQVEGVQVVDAPESEERSCMQVEPEGEVENLYTSLEAESDALKDIESEPERPGDAFQEIVAVTGSTTQEVEGAEEKVEPGVEALTDSSKLSCSKENVNDDGVETPLEADTEPKEVTIDEVEQVEDTEPAHEALTEASEVSSSKEELNQGVETSLEADREPDGETTCVHEPEAEAVVPESEPEVLSESKPDQQGSNETESGQQDLIEVELDKLNVQDVNQQMQQQKRETDSGVEGLELPASEDNQEESLAVSANIEAELDDGSAPSAPEGEVPAIADTGVPANELEMHEEGEVVSPTEEVPKGETEVADVGLVVERKEGAVNDEQLDESKEYIIQQEKADVNDVSDQEKAPSEEVNSSAVPIEQDLDIKRPSAMAVNEDVALREEPHAAERDHSQPILDKQDLTDDPSIIDVPSGKSEMVEQYLSTTLPTESEVNVNEYEPKDGVTFDQKRNFDSPSGDVEKDSGEEETALSTVAEAGSVVNDFDESASYQQMSTDFPSSEQDAEVFGTRESSRAPELFVSGLTEQTDHGGRELDDPSSPRVPEFIGGGLTKQVDGEHADGFGEDSKVAVGDSLNNEVEWKAVRDLEPAPDLVELSPESTKAENPATSRLESVIEVPVDVCLSEESTAPDQEVSIVETEGGGDEDGQSTAPPTLGIVPASESLAVAEELTPKALPSDTDGLHSLPSSKAIMQDLFTPGEGTDNQDNAVGNTIEPEIYTSEAKDSKAVAYAPSRQVLMNTSNGTPPQSTSPGQDIEDVQAFRQQKTQEASLPVVFPAQDVKQRALEQRNLKGNEQSSTGGTLQRNLKGNERPSTGGTLQRRANWLGCCGMFDLLLGKNK